MCLSNLRSGDFDGDGSVGMADLTFLLGEMAVALG
jgi:hypothetical protein